MKHFIPLSVIAAAVVLIELSGCVSAPKFPGTPVQAVSANTEIVGAPVTAVVVTQCNGLLAAYLTMPSGELVRFDQESGLPWTTVLDMASTAARSERIEISCAGEGVEGYEEKVEPVSLTNL